MNKPIESIGILCLLLAACKSPDNVANEHFTDSLSKPSSRVEASVPEREKMPPPMDLTVLSTTPHLSYTSGGSPANGTLCDSTADGFYGFYSLIDTRVHSSNPYVGTLTIFRPGSDMSDWTPTDTNQLFRSVNLQSGMLTVWDSMRVGMSERALKHFIGDRFHYKKGPLLFAEIGGYDCSFSILGDTIHEIEVKVRCASED